MYGVGNEALAPQVGLGPDCALTPLQELGTQMDWPENGLLWDRVGLALF